MKSEKITGYLIDVENETAQVLTIENELNAFYSLLNCSYIEVAERRIGVKSKKYFSIVCDEEGALKFDPRISAIDNVGRAMLVGNIFVVNADYEEGEFISLTDDDISHIKRYIHLQGTRKHPVPYPMLHQVEF